MNIVTLTLNPAIDKSTTTYRLVPEQKLRCGDMLVEAGGGGINVSKGVRKLGGASIAVFPAGGGNGQLLEKILQESGLQTAIHWIQEETRENFAVAEEATNIQYRFNMPGPTLTEADADACLDIIKKHNPHFLVVSGSLPNGLPVNYYEKVAHFAKRIGAKMILDTSGEALKAATEVGLYMLKPNLAELCALTGVEKLEMNQVDDAALEVIHHGKCEVMAVSLGPQGALMVNRDGFEHIPAPMVKKQTTVGAGDSMVAGMVWAFSEGKPLREVVQTGVACGTAATLNKGTQLFHKEDAMRLLKWIEEYGERYRFTDF